MLGPEEDIIQRAPAGIDAHHQQHTHAPAAPARRTLLNDAASLGPQSTALAANPAELRFDSFTPGQPCVQTLQLCNTSTTAVRVTVLPPHTQHFKVVRGETCGRLAPGLSLQLAVQFVGSEAARCDDALHVLTEDSGLLVPLRAQPASSSSGGVQRLPRHLDLGCVALGESASAELPLVNPSAVPRAFTASIQQHNACFEVAPLGGTVPAAGRAAMRVTYTPTRYSTERLQLQVVVAAAQDGAGGADEQAVAHVTITGCVRPGVVRQRMLEAGATQQAATLRPLPPVQQQDQQARGRPARGSDRQAQHGSSRSPKQRSRPPSKLPPVLLAAPVVASARITQHDVNSLLNLRPSRLQVKDVKAAILQHKHQLVAQQQRLQACLSEGEASSLDPLDRPDLGDEVKEALFDMQLREASAGARCGMGSRPGSTPPSAEDAARAHQARQAARAAQEVAQRDAAARRLHTVKAAQGAVRELGSGGYAGLEGFTPQWLLAEGTDCRKRIQAAQRFVHAARVVLLRTRADKRLQQLKRSLTAGHDTHGDAAASLGSDLPDAGACSSSGVPQAPLPPERVRLCELPSWPEVDQQQHLQQQQPHLARQPVAPSHYADYAQLQPLAYEAEFEWRLLGHAAEEYPALMPHVAACDDQPLLPYAPQDGLAVVPCGRLPASLEAGTAGVDAMPARLRAPVVGGSSSPGTPQQQQQQQLQQHVALASSSGGIDPEAKLPRPESWAVPQSLSTGAPGAASLLELPL